MTNRLAKIISFFLGPMFVLIPIPFILVAKSTQDYAYALKWSIFSYAFILAVALFVVVGVFLGFFSNFDVSKREQRPLLFSFSAFAISCYLLSILFFDGPKILFLPLLAVILGLVSIVVVNKWVKASIHLATATAVLLFISIVYKGYSFLFLSLIPLLAWSRIKMKEHTLQETMVGSILGVILTLIVYIISRQFLLEMIYN